MNSHVSIFWESCLCIWNNRTRSRWCCGTWSHVNLRMFWSPPQLFSKKKICWFWEKIGSWGPTTLAEFLLENEIGFLTSWIWLAQKLAQCCGNETQGQIQPVLPKTKSQIYRFLSQSYIDISFQIAAIWSRETGLSRRGPGYEQTLHYPDIPGAELYLQA